MDAGSRAFQPQLHAGKMLALDAGVGAQSNICANDGVERVSDISQVSSAKDHIHFVFAEARVYTVANTAKAQNRSVLKRRRQGHAGGAAEGRGAASHSRAI